MSKDLNEFNARIIPIIEIKNDMIDNCKESWLLFFEDNISKFMKRYPKKLACNDYITFCKDENYLQFSNTKFGLKLKSVVDVHKTSQNNKTIRYYSIKNDIKGKYGIDEKELESDDVEFR
jgi:hypothetical protein